jgi:hypothetical protein
MDELDYLIHINYCISVVKEFCCVAETNAAVVVVVAIVIVIVIVLVVL